MEKGTKLLEGSIWKGVVAFAIPLFLGNLFQQLYNTVDSLIVGNFLGSDALAAVSSSGSLIFLLVGFFNGIAVGAGVVISKYFGARDYENLKKAVHTDVAFGLVSGLLLTVIGMFLAPQILVLMGTPESVLPNSILYFRIYFAGSLAFVMYNIVMGILQAVGDSRHPLYYLIISSITNVVLDLLFVAVFHMGVDGAALATVISQAVSATLGFIRLIRSSSVYRVEPKKVRLNGPMLAKVLHMGVPAGLQNSIISIGNIFVQSGVNLFGATAMAGAGAYSKIEGFGFLPITAFALALTTFVSQNLGAGEYDRAKQGAHFGVITCMVMAESVALLIYLLAPQLLSLFGGDAAMIAIGVKDARTVTPFFFLMALTHSVAGILRGSGKAIVPMGVISICWCLVRVIYISLFSASFTDIAQVFAVYPITWSLSALVFLVFRFTIGWIPKPKTSSPATAPTESR